MDIGLWILSNPIVIDEDLFDWIFTTPGISTKFEGTKENLELLHKIFKSGINPYKTIEELKLELLVLGDIYE